MAKKRRREEPSAQPASPVENITRTGKKIIAGGIGLVVVGFIVLTRTDPMGQNWASHLSPFLILGGYALVALGILWSDEPAEGIPAKAPVSSPVDGPSVGPTA